MPRSIRRRSLRRALSAAALLVLPAPTMAGAQSAADDWTAIAHDHPSGQFSYFYGTWSDGVDVWAAGYRKIPVAGVTEYRTWVQRCNIKSATCDLENTLDLEAAPAYNTIETITGTSSSDIWIGGSGKQRFGDTGTLVEHFNGSKWEIVPTPIARGVVHGLSAAATDDVWAVGNDNRDGITSLAMHWDGIEWTQVPVAVHGCSNVFRLWDIEATGRRPVAVGQCLDAQGEAKSIVITYRKSGWRSEEIFGLSPYKIQLSSISRTGRAVWAGGMTERGQAVALQLHRRVWTSVPTPKDAFVLADVAGTPGDAWGVGSGKDNVVLTMHWDGSTWTNVPDLESGRMTGVVLAPGRQPWAVGTDDDLSVIERYDGPVG